MTDKAVVVISERPEWTPVQRNAARLLAIGRTQAEVASAVAVTRRTVLRWCSDERFWQYVERLHEMAWGRVEREMTANLLLALDVQAQMLRGELPAESPQCRSAERLIDRFVSRLMVRAAPVEEQVAGED